jgi:hypothetical protein
MLDSSYPWWTYSSVDFVEKYLATKSAARVFEWGSGGSSLWLANRCASVVSVEHDENWMPKMVDRLPVNAEIRFVKPEMNQNQHFSSKKHGWKNLNFENYVNSVSQEADKFDLIVIDGRSRVACLSRALENLSSGGMILFDNVQRLRYLRSVLKVDSSVFHRKLFFGRTPCSLLPTFTAVFIKKY